MAGESPDKSEQQKSSGTAPEERDPRLAVFREPAAKSGVSPEADAGTDAEAGPDAGTDADVDADAGSATDRVTDNATAVFRTRPAAAVDGDDDGDGDDDVTPAAASAASEGGSTPPESAEGALASDSDGEASGADEAGATAVADEAAVADEPGEVTGSGEPGAAAGESDAGAEPGDARLRAAVAAWVGDGDGDADDAADTGDTSDATASDDEPAAERETASEAESSGEASGEVRVPKTREEVAVPASKPGAGAKSDSSADAGADSSTGEDADADGESVSAESVPAESVSAESVPAETAADQRGIDQPTAVFKAPKQAQVDHPTTALKIPPREPAPKSGEGSKSRETAETPAERTSKFVPLRSDDVRPAPAPRKPEPAAPAAGAAAASGTGAAASGAGAGSAAGAASGAKPAPAPGPAWAEPERTRQQPLPPKPPLDLLAELTNTPPPQETPVRTAVRRVKIWTPLVVLLLIVFAIVQMVRPLPTPTLQLTAQPTYTFEGSKPKLPWPDQGQGYMAATGLGKVDSFGEQKPVPIASVAKAMTAYIVLREHPLKRGEDGPMIEVDAKGESDGQLFTEGESTLNTVKKGDKISEKDALSALMIPSANNIARLLARWDAGSEKAFVEKMNDTAKQLGMQNTTYTDPSGLNATTVSTAEDLVKLGEKLVEIPALMDITKLPEWKDPSGKVWRNYNTLVPFDGALGIKTGSTSKAGGNLLFAAHKMVDGTDQLIVGAVLGQYSDTSIIDAVNAASKKVMIATQDELKGAKIVKKGQVVGTVDDGLGGTTPVVATKDVQAVGWAGLTVKLELTDGGKTVPHSAAAGTEVGTLTVGEGASQVKVPVALQSELTEPAFGKKLSRIG
ncbi:serine hydrolase [Streptomyces sp. NPDC001787]|uniref:serine hydrolase n=1 Tax=Streptomyces sp. NPDC001787 TaxID=3154523 RepID=UPI00331A71AC